MEYELPDNDDRYENVVVTSDDSSVETDKELASVDVDREPELSKALVVLFLRIPLGGNISRKSVEDDPFETSDTDVSDIDSVALVSSPP